LTTANLTADLTGQISGQFFQKKFKKELEMEKIKNLYLTHDFSWRNSPDSPHICVVKGVLFRYNPPHSHHISREEATRLIIEVGHQLYSPVDWNLLDEYNESRQEFWELTKKFPEEIEKFCELSYSLGLNPLPQLRKGLTIPVHYSCSGNPYRIASVASDEGKPYLVIMHDVETYDCTAAIGHYEYYNSDSDTADEDESLLAVQNEEEEDEAQEFSVPELEEEE